MRHAVVSKNALGLIRGLIRRHPLLARRFCSKEVPYEDRTFLQRLKYRWDHLGEGYYPRGDLVYQGTKEARMRWGHVLTFIHAGGWTIGTFLQYTHPQDGFSLREMCCFTAVAWVAFFAFNVHLRRTIIQLWVQDRRWIHVVTTNWFGTERGFKVANGFVRMAKGRFETHKHPRYNYWLCEIHQKGRYFCIYKDSRGGKYVDPLLFNQVFSHPCAPIPDDYNQKDPSPAWKQQSIAELEHEVVAIPKLENKQQLAIEQARANVDKNQHNVADEEEESPTPATKPRSTKKKNSKPSHWRKKDDNHSYSFLPDKAKQQDPEDKNPFTGQRMKSREK